ncbi:hypothetical protein [Brevundimonas subvibrioides]|uniref:hypothetical protein n=1 Tax=Brevundimonas subvibrioides TaxID=74313 RepID=UPI0022B4076C|nr:hypothetical protein [Brevundimonas subvibrioides]
MSRVLALTAIVACALCLSAFQANPGYSWKPPAGWTTRDNGETPSLTTYFAPDGFTNCIVETRPIAAWNDATQDQVNALAATPFTPEGWADLIGLQPSQVSLLASETRPTDGYYVQFGTFDIAEGATEAPISLRVRMVAILLVGRIVLAGCFSTVENYPGVESVFEQTLSSVRAR